MFLKLHRNLIITGISLITLLLDQASKQIILNYLISNKIYVYKVTNFLNFVEIWNKGISFGIFSEYNLSPMLFICLSSIILFLMLYLMTNINPIIQGLIIGGAMGNLVDRVIFGKVFDFIDFHILDWHYPAFNLADSFIVISVILILISKLRSYILKNGHC
ncbi:signal peptidase II [Candidatus Bandiella numerosa]|uniref:signal peptidase II n=1 Tax=Candidatus Bandiella numerosa TaxID=2570586 RepID=UPI001EFFE23A|nr:signal peptidase II [Candidatus Bandiella numerosa]